MQKPGDWFCPSCSDFQFAKNTQCRRCGAANPHSGGGLHAPGSFPRKPGDWYCPACKDLQFARNSRCNKCGEANPNPTNASGNSLPQKPGDWTCPSCGDLQFARNMACRRCGAANPNPFESLRALQDGLAHTQSTGAGKEIIHKPGDWTCPNCGDLVFARNSHCRKCMTASRASSPLLASPSAMVQGGVFSMLMGNMGGLGAVGGKGAGGPTPRTGDWFCPNCNDLQFARNQSCKRCGTANPGSRDGTGVVSAPPTQAMMPGDWICPGCNDLVFARNDACRRCSTLRSSAAATAPTGQRGGGLLCLAGMSQPLGLPGWPLSLPALMQAAHRTERLAEAPQLALELPPSQSSTAELDPLAEALAAAPGVPELLPIGAPELVPLRAAEPFPPGVREQAPARESRSADRLANATDHVYMKGLPENMTSDWLPKFLQMEDKVTWCKIVWARNGEAHALVKLDSTDSATWAVENLHGQVSSAHGMRLSIDFHRTRTTGVGKVPSRSSPY
uniref:RanBP2-type domain-containing protein n=1 Tax=Alexandrium monilatum TaxID=311494 RepID=A0A7S4RWM7_9DINO|mmetsp:Transcript_72493/g.216265  ORF Transcript_72493/g.216265 Transcript_72493/m.216265 type:complete len:504 (-) Transcript_72493:70-1581(-)